jgi:hypothetical protein
MQKWNKGPKRKAAITSEKGEVFKKTLELEIEKRIVGSSTELREMSAWTFRRVRPLPKRKMSEAQPSEEMEISVRL